MLIGITPDADRRDHSHELQVGDVLLMYTDGLIERRDRAMDDAIASLVAAAGRLSSVTPDDLVRTLTRDIVGDLPADDVVVLAVQVLAHDPF